MKENPAHLADDSTRLEATQWFSLIKDVVVPDKTPCRCISPKLDIAFTAARRQPDSVYIEMPYPGLMLRVTVKVPGWQWYDYDALRWLIPEKMPEVISVTAQYYKLDGCPPFHSEKFEQFINEAIDAAPGCNLNLGGCRGDVRISEHYRYARKLYEEAIRTGDFEGHQLVAALEEHNRVCNVPSLSPEQMGFVHVAVVEDLRNGK